MKEIKLDLWLRVENNNKFVRGKSRVRDEIEDFVLGRFDAEKLRKNGYNYELTVQYENDEGLDDIIYDMLNEMNRIVDCRNCFTEATVSTKDGEKSW